MDGWFHASYVAIIIIVFFGVAIYDYSHPKIITRIDYRNITINNTVTIFQEINRTILINQTCEKCQFDKAYVTKLTNRLLFYERQQDETINQTDCLVNLTNTLLKLNRTEEDYETCNSLLKNCTICISKVNTSVC